MKEDLDAGRQTKRTTKGNQAKMKPRMQRELGKILKDVTEQKNFKDVTKKKAKKFAAVQLLSVSESLQPHGLQHTRLLCPLLSPGVCSNSCPLSQ